MTNSDDLAVAVDLGGTNVRAAVVSRDLVISSVNRRPLDKSSRDALLEGMAASVAQAIAGATAVSGIGVAMKGFVDNKSGVTLSSGFLGMKNIPVGPFLKQRFGLPVYVANDVQAATIGEMVYGAGREHADFIYLNVGTGIAIGLVFGGRLYRGATNLSGEFGNFTVDRDGEIGPGGRAGYLEHVVSGPGIIRLAKRVVESHPKSSMASLVESGEINATRVFQLAEGGDEAAVIVRDHTVAYLGDGIVNLVNVLNPEAIILGGGVFTNAESFVERLEEHVRTNAIGETAASMQRFDISRLEADKAGLIGAAGLVFEHENIE